MTPRYLYEANRRSGRVGFKGRSGSGPGKKNYVQVHQPSGRLTMGIRVPSLTRIPKNVKKAIDTSATFMKQTGVQVGWALKADRVLDPEKKIMSKYINPLVG